MKWKDKLNQALNEVANDIMKLSKEEFDRELENHADGDIAKIMLESGALEVSEIELKHSIIE